MFDYRDSDVVRKIREATGDGVRKAFDAISEEGSQRVVAAAVGREGGKVVLLIKQGEGVTARTDVEFKRASRYFPVLLLLALFALHRCKLLMSLCVHLS